MLATAIKFRDVAYIVAILGLIVWGQGLSLKISGWHLKIANARIEAQDRADRLANELIIKEAIAMGVTNQKAQDYGTQIKKATGDKQRDAIGTRGVRDIVADEPGPK
jgi:hypothetical protein